MTALGLARLQFGVTTIYHFLFVPLTIGLGFLLAVLETAYALRGEERYREMVQFWGRLFLLNFAVGVVTGILQEFQFGMNWASYSRFVGGVFGAPLAVEALLAFFLESTFLGVWIFGWDRLSRRAHCLVMWLVAGGTVLSAFWILAANAFMQQPVGYTLVGGRAEMASFFALVANPQLWVEFPHTVLAALATGAFFMAGLSAYHLRTRPDHPLFRPSFHLGVLVGAIASLLVVVTGHLQAQHLVVAQPMKMAASEALWHTSPLRAPWTVVADIDARHRRDIWALKIPDLLSILAYNRPVGRVPGIAELQAAYARRYGPGDYVPPVLPTFWSFRLMVAAGTLMVLLAWYGLYLVAKDQLAGRRRYLTAMVFATGLPYLANTMGWIMTEVGRQPWVVFGLQRTAAGVSPRVGTGEVVTTLVGFGVLYGILAAVFVALVRRYATAPPAASEEDEELPVLWRTEPEGGPQA